ncbi:thioesterase [Desulfuromonas versatilis]|uniref:Thioesterase n=1 Tax=Desulfuromonas versatilis TaxID=2802975 RepID=A0ABN6DUV4_9BACT|nr:hotdog fold thioesterase [Desulfuromonas versatilis]BCR03771.1 thioesterase [Desulfuromonas versatilis]
MAIWFHEVTLDEVNRLGRGNMIEHLGMEFYEIGPDFLKAKMPVDHRTRQPEGLLHGGASVALAETLGSYAANLVVDPEKYYCVGQEINANHVRGLRQGWVFGATRPLHLGRRSQIWEIQIEDEQERLVCVSRLTMAVVELKSLRTGA